NNSSTEQPDSAISSDISCCWSENHKNHSESDLNSDSVNLNIPTSTCTNPDESNASRISVIRWPQGSIPRRVKKLTWKDEQRNNHLDQLYTGNSIVQAPNPSQPVPVKATKTKTLSGHLLTGTTLLNGHGHYHLQHRHTHTENSSVMDNSTTAVRQHQTPHYPASLTIVDKPTDPTALPDLTVYF
ncbi:hypothetical protein BLA29_012182, partial [Euroglyphus maynei]